MMAMMVMMLFLQRRGNSPTAKARQQSQSNHTLIFKFRFMFIDVSPARKMHAAPAATLAITRGNSPNPTTLATFHIEGHVLHKGKGSAPRRPAAGTRACSDRENAHAAPTSPASARRLCRSPTAASARHQTAKHKGPRRAAPDASAQHAAAETARSRPATQHTWRSSSSLEHLI